MYNEEEQLRLLIRNAILIKNLKENREEQHLRNFVRLLLIEGDVDSDTKPAPYESTPVNMLADAFNQILPVLKSGLRKLAKPEERRSYRDHVIEKFKSIFDGFESMDTGGPGPTLGEGGLNERDEPRLGPAGAGTDDWWTTPFGQKEEGGEEGIKVTIDDPFRIMPSDGKEDDRFKDPEPEPGEELENEFKRFAKPGMNPTGARVAFETINDSNIQSILADKRKTLFDGDDRQEFKEYALYNVDLWLLSYEKELADTKGQEPAFTEPVTEKPAGAKVEPSAAGFEGGGEEMGMEPGMEEEMPEEGLGTGGVPEM